MDITVSNVLNVFNALAELKKLNPQTTSDKINANFSILRPEARKFFELEDAERIAIAEGEISLPLVPIVKDDLPSNMPADLYEQLNPIAKGTFKNRKTEIEKLVESAKENGQEKANEDE